MKDSLYLLVKLSGCIEKKNLIICASLRNDFICNDFVYLVPRIILIETENSIKTIESEYHFSEVSSHYNVSIMSKSGSSKLEIDERYSFSQSTGFELQKLSGKQSDPIEASGSNLQKKSATIFVEDSDGDVEDDLDADSNF